MANTQFFLTALVSTIMILNVQITPAESNSDQNTTGLDATTVVPGYAMPSAVSDTTEKIPLYLGGLFSLGGRSDESGHVPAVEMALDHINQRTDVLREYELRMVWNNTQCYSNLGSRMFIDQILNKPQKLLLIGPPCSTDAPNIAEVSHYWNLISISYGAALPVLSDRKQYPYFFRTVTSTNVFFHLIIRLMREFDWKRVAMIYASHVSSTVIENFVSLVMRANFTLATSEAITEDPAIPLANIERYDAKIIYLAMFPSSARKFFCEAYRRGMTNAGYVWIIYGWYPDLWWTDEDKMLECTVEEMNKAVYSSNILTVRRVQLGAEKHITVAGLTPQQLLTQLRIRMQWPVNRNYTWIDDAPYSYDAVWAAALMLNKTSKDLKEMTFTDRETQRLENFTYGDCEMASMFFDTLQQTNFSGMSGQVAFEDGDRLGDTILGQLQGNEVHDVALYSIRDDSMRWFYDILWQDNYVPIDHTAIVRKHLAIRWGAYVIVCVIIGICILLAGGVLVFNIKYRTLRIVKMSSPNLNNIIISGIFLVYISVVVAGLDSNKVSKEAASTSCQLRVWLLSIGFVLGFGSMFSKTWRVYRVAALKTPRRRVITDNHLFSMVFVFFCIDVVVLLLWHILDPIYLGTVDMAQMSDPKIYNRRIIDYIKQCTSHFYKYWLMALCAYKGLLLLFGTWLAWETRKVTIPALNDSKLIGMCIYNTVVLCIVGVSAGFLINNDTSVLFIFTSCTIIVCAIMTLVILFVPKVISIYTYADGTPPSSNQSAMKSVPSGMSNDSGTEDVKKLRARILELEDQLKDGKHSEGKVGRIHDGLDSSSKIHNDNETGGFTNLAIISEYEEQR